MAEIAEGYTFTATVTLNTYDSLAVLGDIKLPKTTITEDSLGCSASLTLNTTDANAYVGEILRTNTGSHGFTIKGSCSLNVLDKTQYLGDIKHSKIKITEESGDTNASLVLDKTDDSAYIGELLRTNKGSHGYTIKATSILNKHSPSAVIGDIRHSVAIESEQTRDVMADLMLDNMDATDYLGDVLRANTGKQGFTVNANAYLDDYSEQEVIGDMYRSVGGTLWNRLGVVAYKGKFYFAFNKDKIQDILLLEDEDIKNGDDNIDG